MFSHKTEYLVQDIQQQEPVIKITALIGEMFPDLYYDLGEKQL